MRRRTVGGARWLGLVVVGTSLVAGCGSGPEAAKGGGDTGAGVPAGTAAGQASPGAEAVPGSPGAEAAEAATFEPVGSRPIGETVLPRIDEYRLVGVRYAGPGGLEGYLEMDLPLGGEPEAVGEIADILHAVEEERSRPGKEPASQTGAAGTPPPSAFGTMTYELVLARRWVLDLLIEDAGRNPRAFVPAEAALSITARGLEEDVRVQAGCRSLTTLLRRAAWKALRRVTARPRIVRSWHLAATAWILTQEGPLLADLHEPQAWWSEIVDGLRDSPDPEPLAIALLGLPRGAWRGGVDAGKLQALLSSEEISLRVLGLSHEAAAGKRASIDEILRLSLEYFGKEPLFANALAGLFPPEADPDLRRRHPDPASSPTEALRFLNEVRAGAPGATWTPEGWRLSP